MKLDSRLLAVTAAVALGVACSPAPEEPPPAHEDHHEETDRLTLSADAYRAAGIELSTVATRVMAPSIRVTGTLSYDELQMAIATARIGGRITSVLADYGQRVSAGEVLAWIDSPELGVAQAEYRRAVSMTRLRRAEYERAQLLLEGEAVSRGELLRREADWLAAQAAMQTAEQKLNILGMSQPEYEALAMDGAKVGRVYPVRALIAGRVTERVAVPGSVVDANDELFTIAELDSLWLFLQVFEKDLPSVTKGAVVTLTCESHPEDRFRGTIDFVGEVLDPHTRTVRARAVIQNPHGDLKPGMFVYATVEGTHAGETPPARLAVPVRAVTNIEGRDVAFVRSDENSFELRPVVLGEVGGDWVEIRSGLDEGETIAVVGVFTLKSEVLKGGLEGHDH